MLDVFGSGSSKRCKMIGHSRHTGTLDQYSWLPTGKVFLKSRSSELLGVQLVGTRPVVLVGSAPSNHILLLKAFVLKDGTILEERIVESGLTVSLQKSSREQLSQLEHFGSEITGQKYFGPV